MKEDYSTGNQKKMARYAKALGHPVRIYIIDFLVKNGFNDNFALIKILDIDFS